jgi:hypothetical protein
MLSVISRLGALLSLPAVGRGIRRLRIHLRSLVDGLGLLVLNPQVRLMFCSSAGNPMDNAECSNGALVMRGARCALLQDGDESGWRVEGGSVRR